MNPETGHTTQIQLCLDRLRNGDDTAREALIEYASTRLCRLAHKMIKSYPSVRRWEETQDVVQEATMRLHRALAKVQPDSVASFIGLAAVQIRRQLIDLARHYMGPHGMGAHHDTNKAAAKSDKSEQQLVHEPEDPTSGPASLAEWTEFHTFVERLPADERKVFDLHYYGDIPHAEAANILEVSEKTIKRRWQAARLMLHDFIRG